MVWGALTPDEDGRLFIGQGPKVQEFERRFGALVGQETPLPLTTNSCTSALDLALHLIGVSLGDEVITTPMTCTATNSPIVTRRAKIVWADVDPETGLIDPVDVARKVTKRTKAIMAVDWAGRSCDYHALRRGYIPVIQDAAHNLMVDPDNHGDYVAWSFQAIKHLTTVDGGALLVPQKHYERAKLLRWYGLDRESSADFRCAQNITEAGYKYHMNDVNATIGLSNLPHAEWVVSRHRENARWYSENLRGDVLLPPADDKGSWWLYTLRVPDQADFIAHMADRGVMAGQVHARNDTHKAFDYYNGPLPGVDEFSGHQVAIPVGWWLSDADRERVAEAVASFSKVAA